MPNAKVIRQKYEYGMEHNKGAKRSKNCDMSHFRFGLPFTEYYGMKFSICTRYVVHCTWGQSTEILHL